MWYQISREQAAIVCGALRDKRTRIERDLSQGVEYPFYSLEDMLWELSLVMELVEKFYDDGSLSIPFDSNDKYMKW